MKKSVLFFIVAISVAVMLSSCNSLKKVSKMDSTPDYYIINLALVEGAQSNKFLSMDYGIRLNVKDQRSSNKILKTYDYGSVTSIPIVTVNTDVLSFTSASMRSYMRTMGFNLDSDIATDYLMQVLINEYHVSYLSGIGWQGTVSLSIEVHNSDGKLVYPNVKSIGRAHVSGYPTDFALASQAVNKAYVKALEDVDWDRIAFFLKKSSSPSQEANKQVTGDGNTSLENTVIRWYIDSAPKGADVSLRVVSSTPDVKNTNQNYVGSTPYETTEVFDIMGLTYNNSGNVQIEVTCEKAGYVTQKKRFNVRQAIDQKEISTKFNLIKEE